MTPRQTAVFPPLPRRIRARIAGATVVELNAWLDNILDASSLDAVFEDPRAQTQINTAANIDAEVIRLLKLDGDEALLMGMLPLMARFSKLSSASR